MYLKNMDKHLHLKQKIELYNNIIIAKHVSPDWDTQGSAYGLREIINNNYPDKNVYVVGEVLNLDKREKDEKILTNKIIESSLLITVDVANYERIDFEKKDKVKEIYKIDHHIEVDNFGNYKLVDSSSIACTQILALWAKNIGMTLSKKAATYLYYGLITDSGRFYFDKTNEETFLAAQILLSCGISIKEIYEDLYLKNLELVKWHHKAFGMAEFINNDQIGYIKIPQQYFESLNLGEEEVKSALTVLSNIRQVKIWFIAYQNSKDKAIKISLRSRDYNVNEVAVKYNGGGHKLASGAKINSWDELNNLLNDLQKLIK